MIDFSTTNENEPFFSPLIPWNFVKQPKGTYIMVRIPHPGDPSIFVHDLLVIKKELDRGRIIGRSVPSWQWEAANGFFFGTGVKITPLKVMLLADQQQPAEDDSVEDDSSEAASAS